MCYLETHFLYNWQLVGLLVDMDSESENLSEFRLFLGHLNQIFFHVVPSYFTQE